MEIELSRVDRRTLILRILAGIGLSLAVHVAVMIIFTLPVPNSRLTLGRPERVLVVRLIEQSTQKESAIQDIDVKKPAAPREHHAPGIAFDNRPKRSTEVKVAASPGSVTVTPSTSEPAPNVTAAPAPRMNLDVLVKSAGKADLAARAKDERPVAQFQRQQRAIDDDDTALGAAVASSRRPDCLTMAQGAGLLAPLVLAAHAVIDKKDSGCKYR